MRGDFFDEAMQYRDVDLAAQRRVEEEIMSESESKHTQGPWQTHGSHVYAADPGRELIAQILSGANCIADLALIVAAPDLLAALKAYLGAYATQSGVDWRKTEEMARAAIARAEGR